MPVSSQTSEKLKVNAASMPRDAKGHFIKRNTNPADAVSKEIKTETPLETIKTPTVISDIDAPLVVINNPFKKLLHWFDEIRRKQTTTFDFKISIPLIALPIFLIVLGTAFQYVFTLGKESSTTPPAQTTIYPTPTAEPLLISKAGVIKATYQLQSQVHTSTLISRAVYTEQSRSVLAEEVTPTPTSLPTETPIPPTATPLPTYTPTPTMTPTPTIPPTRFVLVDKDEKIFFLITPKNIDLNRYSNQRVLITGLYDPSKETITIKKYSDIEVLP